MIEHNLYTIVFFIGMGKHMGSIVCENCIQTINNGCDKKITINKYLQ